MCCLLWAGLAVKGWGAPPLTTIQDTLYKADGSLFHGVLMINWRSFEGPDSSNIPTNSLTTQVVKGRLFVKLVPTTTAATAAYYSVRYVSDGSIQFTELWSVPPSAAPLRVKDVRIAWPPSGGSAGASTQVQIGDVVGLTNELDMRAVKGPAFAHSRAAVISASGELEGATGSPSDCIRVDGTAGPCGSGDGNEESAGFIDAETPTGAVDGFNTSFTLAGSPNPASSLLLYRNGLLQKQGLDYSLAGNNIIFVIEAKPQAGDVLLASYRIGGSSSNGPQVLCSGTGASTSQTSMTSLGTCTIPGDFVRAGDRFETAFDYSHSGATTGFSIEVRWGSATVAARSAAGTESLVTGRAQAAVHGGGTQLSVQSWGSSLALAAGASASAAAAGTAVTVNFMGAMAGTTAETVALRNFTVIRYPSNTGQ